MANKYWKLVKYAALSLAVGCFASSAVNAAAKFPKKQVQIVVPYAPGGASDTVAVFTARNWKKNSENL